MQIESDTLVGPGVHRLPPQHRGQGKQPLIFFLVANRSQIRYMIGSGMVNSSTFGMSSDAKLAHRPRTFLGWEDAIRSTQMPLVVAWLFSTPYDASADSLRTFHLFFSRVWPHHQEGNVQRQSGFPSQHETILTMVMWRPSRSPL